MHCQEVHRDFVVHATHTADHTEKGEDRENSGKYGTGLEQHRLGLDVPVVLLRRGVGVIQGPMDGVCAGVVLRGHDVFQRVRQDLRTFHLGLVGLVGCAEQVQAGAEMGEGVDSDVTFLVGGHGTHAVRAEFTGALGHEDGHGVLDLLGGVRVDHLAGLEHVGHAQGHGELSILDALKLRRRSLLHHQQVLVKVRGVPNGTRILDKRIAKKEHEEGLVHSVRHDDGGKHERIGGGHHLLTDQNGQHDATSDSARSVVPKHAFKCTNAFGLESKITV
mmetsp:Transcript_8645/g.14631  ORF Transcript_8645/g.14631 Transcript_8645/m.14631 type:complete len:276 (+) Transcript_8645:2085-2912(+)